MTGQGDADDPLLRVQRGIAGNICRRYGGRRHHDREDAIATGMLAVLSYWVPKYGPVTFGNVELAVRFGITRASESFLGELDRQEAERLYAADEDGDDTGWLERAAEAARQRAGVDPGESRYSRLLVR